jgi:dGTPase
MEGSFNAELYTVTPAQTYIDALKKLSRKQVYTSHQTLKLELMGREVIHFLMDLLWEGISGYSPEDSPSTKTFSQKVINLISTNYKDAYKIGVESGLPINYCRAQLMTDYVCGMTDSFAVSLYKQIKHG